MPFQTRPAAVKISVLAFFLVALIGQYNSVSPFACCKRAILAAILAYIVTTLFINALNFVLLNAMIDKEVDRQKDFRDDG